MKRIIPHIYGTTVSSQLTTYLVLWASSWRNGTETALLFDSEMNPDVTIKIIGIFAIFALSLLGYIIPLNAPRLRLSSIYSIGGSNWTSSSLFHVTKAFSSGVILGVALLHLVAESLEILDDYSLYPSKSY